MQTLLQDLRYGLRMLLNKPGFAAVAVITLALGIGANTAIFSVVNAVLLRPLPYREPGKLVRVYTEFPTMNLRKFWMSAPEFLDIQNEADSWESIGSWTMTGRNVATSNDEPVRVTAAIITRSLIDTLGVQPVIGRNFTPEEDRNGGPNTVLISDGLWRRAFGKQDDIVGKQIQVNSQATTVVGVMPPGFVFPPGSNDPAEVWLPIQFDPANPGNRGGHFLYVIGRLKPDVKVEQARSEIDSLMAGWKSANRAQHLPGPDGHPILMVPLHEDVVGAARPAVLMLLGAVGFVLLIACVNVANLLLARAESRRREFSIRLALGAGRNRLLRQFLAEGMILVVLGAVAGMVLAKVGLGLVIGAAPDSIPRTAEVGIDPAVLAFTLGVSILSTIVFAMAPLLQMRDRDLATTLRGSGQRTSGGGGSHRLRKTLVIAEIALAVIPVVGSGLMIRAFWKLRQVDVGFDPRGVTAFTLQLPASKYQAPDRLRFANQLEERLTALPGVKSASVAAGLPPLRPINANDTDIEDYQSTPDGPAENVDYWNTVNEGYFKTMGIRTLEGRTFENTDRNENAQKVMVINQAMARRFWQGSPIGRRVNPGFQTPAVWFTVIGIVEDTKNMGVDKPGGTELYFLQPQTAAFGVSTRMSFVVKTESTSASAIASSIRTTVSDLDPSVPVFQLQTMSDIVADSLVRPRFLSLLLGAFSAIALSLAAIGIYGVMAYSVAQRTQEIGVRVALGATTRNVLSMVVGEGLKMTVVGLAVGLTGAMLLTRVMASLLFEVSATDPFTFVMVGISLTVVGLVACFVPARRAAKVDPMIAVRYE
ncbi:MAG: ABC transporter permease [Acidobacteria bacterium]|nr:MAG: ABC transporter permease [Acidobacteriota bacterium]